MQKKTATAFKVYTYIWLSINDFIKEIWYLRATDRKMQHTNPMKIKNKPIQYFFSMFFER